MILPEPAPTSPTALADTACLVETDAGTGHGTEAEPEPGPASRTGAVEMESVALIQFPELSGSEDFRQMNERLRASEAILQSHQERGHVPLDALLTAALDRLVEEGSVDGLLVGSEDGFVVARSSRLDEAELLAVIGTVFDFVARRIQSERLISAVEELTARGPRGEMVVMRYLPGLENRFFLVAFARAAATYRRTMARALKQCGALLGVQLGRSPTSPPASRRAQAKSDVAPSERDEAHPVLAVEPPPSGSREAFPTATGPADGIITPNSLTQN